jgi:hypothetical protein
MTVVRSAIRNDLEVAVDVEDVPEPLSGGVSECQSLRPNRSTVSQVVSQADRIRTHQTKGRREKNRCRDRHQLGRLIHLED